MLAKLSKQPIRPAWRLARPILPVLAGLASLLLLALLAGSSAAAPPSAPSRALAAQPVGGAAGATSTPACCGQLASDILASCSFDPQSGTFSFPYYVFVYNSCPAPAAVTVVAAIQVSADYQNWGQVVQSTPVSLVVQPGYPPATIQASFTNIAIPTPNRWYRGVVSMYEPNSCQSYTWIAQPNTLCWPPVSPTPSLTSTPTRTPSATPNGCPPSWQVANSPSLGTSSTLRAVSASGPADVWAVGYAMQGSTNSSTLAEHWNGTAWTIVPTPNLGSRNSRLFGVAALSPSDAWAVGYYEDAQLVSQPLILHWDGTAWTVVPDPPSTPSLGPLASVSALAANNIWVAGAGGYERTVILHWDGSTWSIVPSPSVAGWFNTLNSISARTPTDIWAAGSLDYAGAAQTLTLHWDGATWSIVPNPDPGPANNFLYGVVAVGANDAWAVGTSANGSTLAGALLEHWNGSAWSVVPGPPVAAVLYSVAAVAASDIWAAGVAWNGTINVTLVEHWDGANWSIVPSPSPSTYAANDLYGVTALNATDAWAVGDSYPGTLILHYAPTCGTPGPTSTPWPDPTPLPPTHTPWPDPTPLLPTSTPSPSPTPWPPRGTPGVSATPPRPTSTPGSSPTPCTVGFSDVQPTDYFYAPVQYLACGGVISGYGDGTFRPYTPTTRAQMVKIVVLGFGLPAQTPLGGDYTFADVPLAQPFFAVIETAAAHNIVSGYTCGGVGEPCDEEHRPYFRPNANVTRGQLSKIVVGTAGWPVLNPVAPTFADVPPGSTFYTFVETAICHGVISGYADHTFHPGANATRGQIAKIVYGALTTSAVCR